MAQAFVNAKNKAKQTGAPIVTATQKPPTITLKKYTMIDLYRRNLKTWPQLSDDPFSFMGIQCEQDIIFNKSEVYDGGPNSLYYEYIFPKPMKFEGKELIYKYSWFKKDSL